MQFLISVIDDRTDTATAEEIEAIDAFNDRLKEHGHWVVAGGLTAPDAAAVIDGRSEHPVVVEGPLHTATEYLSGFWLVFAADQATAQALAVEGSRACNRRVELRPLLGG